jgi:hypothetical protein
VNEAQRQDIEATIKILKRGGINAKIISFLCFWYPFKGSIKDHILYLENELKSEVRLVDIIGKAKFVMESCPCGLVIGIKRSDRGKGDGCV